MTRLSERRPLLYYITDRAALLAPSDLPTVIERAIAAGVDLIQIRERALGEGELLRLVEAALACTRGTSTRVLVNDRLDVALAAGAAGVHLPSHGFTAAEVRRRYPELLIGVSCHNLEELHHAGEGGADFAVFGPVFETASKRAYGPPLGVEKLGLAVSSTKLPVLALGGITMTNARACLEAGAAGLAAISLFQGSADLKATVRELRGLAGGA